MLCALAVAFALQHPQLKSDVRIYSPEKPVKEQNFTLKKWGGGSFAESDWVVLYGTRSLRLTSTNYAQGGSIAFKEPLDLSPAFKDPSKLLRFSFFLESPGVTYAKTAKNVIVKYKQRESYDVGQKNVLVKSTVTKIRMIFTTADGKKSEFYMPVNASKQATTDGWRTAAIPVRVLTGIKNTDMQVKDILFSLDSRGIIYLGDIDVATDTIPITVDIEPRQLVVKPGSKVTFTADGEAGLTPLRYQWDFDASNGIQPEADAQGVQHTFRKTGDYTVTVTVTDRFGIKKPVQKTARVQVMK